MIGAVSLAVASAFARFGGRGAFPFLGGGFLGLAAISLAASRFFVLDILFVTDGSSLAVGRRHDAAKPTSQRRSQAD